MFLVSEKSWCEMDFGFRVSDGFRVRLELKVKGGARNLADLLGELGVVRNDHHAAVVRLRPPPKRQGEFRVISFRTETLRSVKHQNSQPIPPSKRQRLQHTQVAKCQDIHHKQDD